MATNTIKVSIYKERYYVVKGGKWFRFTDGAYDHTDSFLTATGTTRIDEALRMMEYSGEGSEIMLMNLTAEGAQVARSVIDERVRHNALGKLTRKEKEVLGL